MLLEHGRTCFRAANCCNFSGSAACAPVRFWAVAAAPTPDDPQTHMFIDSLCPDVLEALVHTLLLLQVRILFSQVMRVMALSSSSC